MKDLCPSEIDRETVVETGSSDFSGKPAGIYVADIDLSRLNN